MFTPASEWKEDDVLSLPQDENDTFERKGARLLDLTLPQVKEGDVLSELAKQLSAFANTGGGQIVYGLDDNCMVDNGGVARLVKGRQATKDWLENVIPTLTDFEIVGLNVYEILPKKTGSLLSPDKSLYVVDVPASDRAPHQSKRDFKYYIRLGGKSQPASHRLVEDIRNRALHPKVEVHDVRIIQVGHDGLPPRASQFDIGLNLNLECGVQNAGRVKATNTCLQFSSSVPLFAKMGGGDGFSFRWGTPGTILMEMQSPLYPSMGVRLTALVQMPVKILNAECADPSFLVGQSDPANVILRFTVFADSAPSREQEFRLTDIDPSQHLRRAVNQAAGYTRIRRA
jgi:hypothetical protein